MANSGQGGRNWLCGVPKRSAGLTGPHGDSACQMPAGATGFTSYSSRNASNTPRDCTSLPALPSLMIQPRRPATVSSASVICFRWISFFCRIGEIMLLRRISWARLGTYALRSLSPMRARLDATDWRILKELQANGRISNVDLARKVGISPPPCLRRVRALEQAGMIAGYFGMLDEKSVGFEVIAFAMVGLHSQAEADLRAFENRVLAWPLVRECYMLLGRNRLSAQVRRPRPDGIPGLHHRRADGGAQRRPASRRRSSSAASSSSPAFPWRWPSDAAPYDASVSRCYAASTPLLARAGNISGPRHVVAGPAGRQARDGRDP